MNLNTLADSIHSNNKNWWIDIVTGEKINRNIPEMLMLVVSELAEAMEGYRKGLMDTHLPHREMLEVELADAVIRILDLSAGLKLDLDGALHEKLEYNKHREDHKIENRLKAGGKKF